MREKLARFMQGRYGFDSLTGFIMGAAAVLLLINAFTGFWVLNVAVLAMIIWSYCRMLSKNVGKRYDENCRYLNYRTKLFGFFKGIGSKLSDRRKYLMFKCPDCGQKMRVPRGRGKIIVTCPKCRKQIYKKS